MRRLSIIVAIALILASCSSYTIADGRNNISIPEYENLPSTKAKKEVVEEVQEEPVVEEVVLPSADANAMFLYLPEENLSEASFNTIINTIDEINPDIIVLLGSRCNQNLFAAAYSNVYELEGAYIILSGRLENTNSLELYLDNIYAILAQTEFPILSSI